MKILAINGSPRKNRNTAILLKETLLGASSIGADTEYIDLYDKSFKGCSSCFACKQLNSKSYGKCIINDELQPILEKIERADAVVFGSPIYWGNLTGSIRNLLERLLFQYLVYDKHYSSLAPKTLKTALICTMNVTEIQAEEGGYLAVINATAGQLKHILGSSEVLLSTNTCQFDDYSKYETSGIDISNKTKHRNEQFPLDRKKAFELGSKLLVGNTI